MIWKHFLTVALISTVQSQSFKTDNRTESVTQMETETVQ